MKIIFSVVISLIGLLQIFAQEIYISGKVTDGNTGEALPGVNITVLGTPFGVITDLDGNYTIPVVPGNKLVFSSIGYINKEVIVGTLREINIELKPEVGEVDEIVVVGYGTLTRKDLIGSVSSVKIQKATENNNASSVNELLQGRASGVYVSTNSGVPGGAVSVSIRGVGSISSSSQPLYVIDDIVMDETSKDIDGNELTQSNPLEFLSSDDVASIEVLKDASATAIYGSRGANGVIMITTKNGKEGEKIIEYSGSVGISNVTKHLELLNGNEYINYRNELDRISTGDTEPKFSLDSIKPVNWQDEFFGTGISQKHRIAISSSKNGSTHYFSLGYVKSDGIIKTTGIDKFGFRANFSRSINNRISLSSNITGAYIDNDHTTGTSMLGGDRSLMGSIITSEPLIRNYVYDDQGLFDFEDLPTNNPYAWTNHYKDNTIEKTLITKFNIDVEFFEWLKYTGQCGLNVRSKERSVYWGRGTNKGNDYNGLTELYLWENTHYVIDNIFKINKKINRHRVNATLALTYDSKLNKKRIFESKDFVDDYSSFEALSAGAEQTILLTGKTPASYTSGVFRLVYNYKNLSFAMSGRADGSSKFSDGNKWGFFPSLATAYNLHGLNIVKKIRFISNLKLRADWGRVGNSSLQEYATRNIASFSSFYDGTSTFTVASLDTRGNPDLTWEKSEQTNIALDIGVFENRLQFVSEVYLINTRDLLQKAPMPASTGFSYQWVNDGSVQNKGLELNLKAIILDKDVKVSVGGNIAFNRNKITDIGFGVPDHNGQIIHYGDNIGDGLSLESPVNVFIENQPVGVFWGYKADGITQLGDTITMFGSPVEPGNINIVDVSGPEGKKDGIIDNYDITIIGDPNPKFIYGFDIDLAYKNLSLHALFQGVYGNDIFNANYVNIRNHSKPAKNKLVESYTEAWTPQNMSNTHPRLDMSNVIIEDGRFTDRWVEDGSYLKLSVLSLKYVLQLKEVPVIQSITLNASIDNVFTITRYPGFNPEVSSFSSNPLITGVDQGGYPSVRTYRFGINVRF